MHRSVILDYSGYHPECCILQWREIFCSLQIIKKYDESMCLSLSRSHRLQGWKRIKQNYDARNFYTAARTSPNAIIDSLNSDCAQTEMWEEQLHNSTASSMILRMSFESGMTSQLRVQDSLITIRDRDDCTAVNMFASNAIAIAIHDRQMKLRWCVH